MPSREPSRGLHVYIFDTDAVALVYPLDDALKVLVDQLPFWALNVKVGVSAGPLVATVRLIEAPLVGDVKVPPPAGVVRDTV